MSNYTIAHTPGADRTILEATCRGCRTTWRYTASDLVANLAADLAQHDAVHDGHTLDHAGVQSFGSLGWLVDMVDEVATSAREIGAA